ncbi:Uncharacterized HTH-type transcriptional regulator yybR [Chromobacterium violaceum]|uniref:Uncharacterized HTH-type transcriptional regulator yybR n=1 Tax=Chromobacterium violaceum TaxID=536 RepID=A0A447TCG8_CHRVL|nr:Uncharacterized HTH-type transcriptional regulator yybR [Chromobacterium violaceum]
MAASHCPMLRFVDLIAGKWAIPILYRLIVLDRPVRFGELQRAVGVITQKELTRQLRAFEQRGLVQRTVYAEVPPASSTGSPRWAARCSSRCSSWRDGWSAMAANCAAKHAVNRPAARTAAPGAGDEAVAALPERRHASRRPTVSDSQAFSPPPASCRRQPKRSAKRRMKTMPRGDGDRGLWGIVLASSTRTKAIVGHAMARHFDAQSIRLK